MKLEIKNLTTTTNQAWDDYVNNHPNSTFFHLSGWKQVLESAFGHKTYFIYAIQGSTVVGLLPLARVKSYLFSDSLISLPFSVYAGVLANDEEVKNALVNKAIEIATGLGVATLELRHEREEFSDWPRKDLYVTFKKELDPDVEKNLLAIPRKQRAMVRKGIKNGLKGQEDTTVDRLYEAYSESLRNLGTPVFSKNYLKILKATFGDKCRVLSITDTDDNLVASVMSFYFKNEVLPYYGGSKSSARALAANDFMYWELMRQSVEAGVGVFDYGRSKEGTGSYRFKTHWGFVPVPLNYEVKLIKATEIPEINPLNPKYQLFIKLWKKLPLSVANTIGPFLAKSLG
jgi:FemAB-related protein (PEP-CTERM system-associated)